jgi:hypothetical protein
MGKIVRAYRDESKGMENVDWQWIADEMNTMNGTVRTAEECKYVLPKDILPANLSRAILTLHVIAGSE